jgi:hypothetical protein
MTTGWVFTLGGIASDVAGPLPRRAYSSIHSSACAAMVSLLFALDEALLRDPCERAGRLWCYVALTSLAAPHSAPGFARRACLCRTASYNSAGVAVCAAALLKSVR